MGLGHQGRRRALKQSKLRTTVFYLSSGRVSFLLNDRQADRHIEKVIAVVVGDFQTLAGRVQALAAVRP
jgi:hypothetical protein